MAQAHHRIGRSRPARAGRPASRAVRAALSRPLALGLLLPFLLLSLVHPGTMPARDALGHVTMILCGSDQPVDMVIASDGTVSPATTAEDAGGKVPGGTGTDPHGCAWAPHGAALLGLDPVAIALPVAALAGLADAALPRAPARGRDLPPWRARGPPVISGMLPGAA